MRCEAVFEYCPNNTSPVRPPRRLAIIVVHLALTTRSIIIKDHVGSHRLRSGLLVRGQRSSHFLRLLFWLSELSPPNSLFTLACDNAAIMARQSLRFSLCSECSICPHLAYPCPFFGLHLNPYACCTQPWSLRVDGLVGCRLSRRPSTYTMSRFGLKTLVAS